MAIMGLSTGLSVTLLFIILSFMGNFRPSNDLQALPYVIFADAARAASLVVSFGKKKQKSAEAEEEKIKKAKEAVELKAKIGSLLSRNPDFVDLEAKRLEEEELNIYSVEELEKEKFYADEYEKYEKSRNRTENSTWAAVTAGGMGTLMGAMGALTRSNDEMTLDEKLLKDKISRGFFSAALVAAAGAGLAFLLRRRAQRSMAFHDRRLMRMHFEARSGIKPGEEALLGPDDLEAVDPVVPKKNKDE